ncbi:hypothetical protein JCM13664_02810 [Methylothermus subterraneus]
MSKRLCKLLVLLYLTPALALPPWPEAIRGDWKEMPTPEPLPPFCRPKQMGESEWRMHGAIPGLNHFCDAKVKRFICLKYSGKDRAACLSYLARGVHDAIRGAQEKSPNHPLVPYLHTEYANFLAEAGDFPHAVQEYLQAVRINKKYLPAYVKLANVLIKTKEYDKAEKTLQYALKIQKNKRHEAYLKKQLAKVAALKAKSQ